MTTLKYETTEMVSTARGLMQKWDMGMQLDIVYIVESSGKDEEVNADYSNLVQKECPTLGDAMYIMQQWQRGGYQNINVMTQVKHNGAVVVEDTASDVQFVSNEERDLREAYDTMCDAYGKTLAFIDTYKARKVYEEYIVAQ